MLLCLPSAVQWRLSFGPSFQQINSFKPPNSQKAATRLVSDEALVPSSATGCRLAGHLGHWQHRTSPWTGTGRTPLYHHRVAENIGSTFRQTHAKPSTMKLPKWYLSQLYELLIRGAGKEVILPIPVPTNDVNWHCSDSWCPVLHQGERTEGQCSRYPSGGQRKAACIHSEQEPGKPRLEFEGEKWSRVEDDLGKMTW